MHGNKIQASCDGISEAKSSSTSIDVYSTKPINCKIVYPHRLVRPLAKGHISNKLELTEFIKDLIAEEYEVEQFVADNLKRANAREALNHASKNACEYCFSSGMSIELRKQETENLNKQLQKEKEIVLEKINKLINEPSTSTSNEIDMLQEIVANIDQKIKQNRIKKSHIIWPFSTMEGEERTHEKVLEIIEKVENNEISREEAKGILGRSPLLLLDNFNIVLDVPTEYLHSVCIGVVKRLIILSFNVGEKRPAKKNRKLSSPETYNKLMANIKVFREFPRRARDLNLSVMKGQEYRNVILFFFPLIIKCLSEKVEKKIWMLFAYMIRSCILPDEEFACVNETSVTNASKQFYKLYESFFGELNCSYNFHVVASHLMKMRVHGPLTFTSAFPFENFYGELRRSFVPGTQSTLKQMLQKILVKRIMSPHNCEKTIYVSDQNTEMECNNMIYLFKDNTYHFITSSQKVKEVKNCCVAEWENTLILTQNYNH